MDYIYNLRVLGHKSQQQHLLTTRIASSYLNWVYHEQPLTLNIGI